MLWKLSRSLNNFLSIGTEVELVFILHGREQRVRGKIVGTPYQFCGHWKFPFLVEGDPVENLQSIRLDLVDCIKDYNE